MSRLGVDEVKVKAKAEAKLLTHVNALITGPPTHSVEGARLVTVAGVCSMSGSVTLHGGPVVLRSVRATPYFDISTTAHMTS